jgi:hypothetical protein
MSRFSRFVRWTAFLMALAAGGGWPAGPAAAADADHLVLSEVVVLIRTPVTDGSKFVEIVNPTAVQIDLVDYYLTDATNSPTSFYYKIVTGQGAGGGVGGDFHARFPAGAVIAAGDTIVVAIKGSEQYQAAYGRLPDYELYEDGDVPDAVPDMVAAFPGAIGAGLGSSGTNVPDLLQDGESVVLYHWDGQTDLVQDVDYIIWGTFSSVRVNKNGVAIDGPDPGTDPSTYLPDTPVGSQVPIATAAHRPGGSFRRNSADEGSETASGGNGITLHDETSEPLSTTWFSANDQDPPAAPAVWTPAAPIVFGATLNPSDPYAGAPVTMSATVVAYDGMASVDVLYRVDAGIWQTAVGNDAGGGIWEATIPGQAGDAVVEWYVQATGNDGGIATYPTNAPIFQQSYTVALTPNVQFLEVVLVPPTPFAGQATTITATVQSAATVTGVTLFYRLDGGTYSEVAATDNGDGTWSVPIPAQPAATVVDWYLTADAAGGGSGVHPAGAPGVPASFTVATVPTGPAHLLLSEVCVMAVAQEFIEIRNLEVYPVDLSNYYLTDAIYRWGDTNYWNIVRPNPNADTIGGGVYTDFFARFPDGVIIPAGGSITVSISGSDNFASQYGFLPSFELYEDADFEDTVPDMREVFPGSIVGTTSPTLTDTGETAILFYWDGQSDLVTDIDVFFWGSDWDNTAQAFSKNGVFIDGPDPDSATSLYAPETLIPNQHPYPAGTGNTTGAGNSYQRVDFDESDESPIDGNGIDGQDEVSENFPLGWEIAPADPAQPPVPSGAGKQLVLKVPGRTFLPRIGESFPIRFITKARAQTTVRIFDLEGRLVVTIYDSRFDGPASVIPDEYSQRNWDGRDSTFELVPAGLYIVHLQAVDQETGDVDSKTAPVVVATRLSQ